MRRGRGGSHPLQFSSTSECSISTIDHDETCRRRRTPRQTNASLRSLPNRGILGATGTTHLNGGGGVFSSILYRNTSPTQLELALEAGFLTLRIRYFPTKILVNFDAVFMFILPIMSYLILEAPGDGLDIDAEEGVDCLLSNLVERSRHEDARVVESNV